MANIDNLIEEANQAEANFRAAVKRIAADAHQSAEGKTFYVAQAREARDAALAAIRQRAEDYLIASRQHTERALQAARASQSDAQRATLGDVVYADLLKTALATMDGAGIVAAHAEAATAFDRTVIGAYGRHVLGQRSTVEAATTLYQLEQQIAAADPLAADVAKHAGELRSVVQSEKRMGELDPAAYASELGDIYGVNPALIGAG